MKIFDRWHELRARWLAREVVRLSGGAISQDAALDRSRRIGPIQWRAMGPYALARSLALQLIVEAASSDDLDRLIAQELRDPVFARAWGESEKELRRRERAYRRRERE